VSDESASRAITIVTGLGRCGSSLVMRMLHRGGMPVVADDFASYEDLRVTLLPAHAEWLPECVGKALKILDPHEHLLPSAIYAYRFLWLTRDLREQARSQVKFIRANGFRIESQAWRWTERGLAKDVKRSIDVLQSRYQSSTLLPIRFEHLLAQPGAEARRIAEFCGLAPERAPIMAACVKQRTPKCLPYLMEYEIVAEEEAARG